MDGGFTGNSLTSFLITSLIGFPKLFRDDKIIAQISEQLEKQMIQNSGFSRDLCNYKENNWLVI
jgi:hypothetical protein